MNILEHITELRLERGWSEYQLAERSGLTQSTISSWYRKNMVPSISSLERICDAFQISLSQFFWTDEENTVEISENEKRLLRYYSTLSPQQQAALLSLLDTDHKSTR